MIFCIIAWMLSLINLFIFDFSNVWSFLIGKPEIITETIITNMNSIDNFNIQEDLLLKEMNEILNELKEIKSDSYMLNNKINFFEWQIKINEVTVKLDNFGLINKEFLETKGINVWTLARKNI